MWAFCQIVISRYFESDDSAFASSNGTVGLNDYQFTCSCRSLYLGTTTLDTASLLNRIIYVIQAIGESQRSLQHSGFLVIVEEE